MSATRKAFVKKPSRMANSAEKELVEADDVSYEYQNGESPVNGSANSKDLNLIRTRDLSRQKRSGKVSSLSHISVKRLLIAGAIVLAIAAIIIVPTVLGVVLSRNPLVSNNTTQTTVVNYTTVYWAFDNNGSDLSGIYNGILQNGAQYSNNTYFGQGFNLQLSALVNQSFTVSSSYLSFAYTSFTVEAWIYGYTLTGDNSIFSQCACSSCQDQCLYLIIRNAKLYMGFTLDDLVGLTSLSVNTWYHVAFVYDYSAQTQSVYIQGVLDNSKSSAGPYKGGNASIVIGSSQLSGSAFNGFIDNLKVTLKAKSAAELLYAASVVVYFSFDGSSLTQDMGPNGMNGSLSNAAGVTGRVGQGLVFSGATSYLIIYGFYQLGQSSKPFTIALWIYPYSVTGATIIHKSQYGSVSGGWIQDMMGLTYTGQISIRTNGASQVITGPFISTLQWTHITFAYSSTNGQSLYINGVLFMNSGPCSFSSSSAIDWITVGYNFGSGTNSPINGGYFFGAVDEFYVYRREISASEAYALANP